MAHPFEMLAGKRHKLFIERMLVRAIKDLAKLADYSYTKVWDELRIQTLKDEKEEAQKLSGPQGEEVHG